MKLIRLMLDERLHCHRRVCYWNNRYHRSVHLLELEREHTEGCIGRGRQN